MLPQPGLALSCLTSPGSLECLLGATCSCFADQTRQGCCAYHAESEGLPVAWLGLCGKGRGVQGLWSHTLILLHSMGLKQDIVEVNC